MGKLESNGSLIIGHGHLPETFLLHPFFKIEEYTALDPN
jgi:hypothetical protein